MSEQEELKACPIAGIVNSLFLDSDYQGKDWEAVRYNLIEELRRLWNSRKPQGDLSEQSHPSPVRGPSIEEIRNKLEPFHGQEIYDSTLDEMSEAICNLLTEQKG